MQNEIDKHGRLDEEIFGYRTNKENSKVFISYEGRQVMILKDKEAQRFLTRVAQAGDDTKQVQLIMAKITGNFKRGNEREGKETNK